MSAIPSIRISTRMCLKVVHLDRRRLIPIFATVFTNILGAGVILPILPLVAVDAYDATPFQATLLAAAYFGAQFLAGPWLGRLSDRVGRRPVLIVSQLGTVLSFVMFALAGPIGNAIGDVGTDVTMSGGLIVLYLARILDGLTGGNITTARAYITDVSSEESRAQALGTINAAFGLGFIFGPVLGGLLAEVSLVAPFIGAAIITSGSVLLTTFFLEESLPPEERATQARGGHAMPLRHFLRDGGVLFILMITFMVTVSFAALQSTFALYAERVLFPEAESSAMVARNVGLMFTFAGVILVVTQALFIRPLVRRLGERQVVVLGQLCLLFAFAAIAAVSSPLLVTLLFAPVAFGNGINQPSLQALVTRYGTPQTRGGLLGVFQSANSLALILGPIWAGYVFQTVHPRAPYVVSVAGLLVGVSLSLLLRRRPLPGYAAGMVES